MKKLLLISFIFLNCSFAWGAETLSGIEEKPDIPLQRHYGDVLHATVAIATLTVGEENSRLAMEGSNGIPGEHSPLFQSDMVSMVMPRSGILRNLFVHGYSPVPIRVGTEVQVMIRVNEHNTALYIIRDNSDEITSITANTDDYVFVHQGDRVDVKFTATTLQPSVTGTNVFLKATFLFQ